MLYGRVLAANSTLQVERPSKTVGGSHVEAPSSPGLVHRQHYRRLGYESSLIILVSRSSCRKSLASITRISLIE